MVLAGILTYRSVKGIQGWGQQQCLLLLTAAVVALNP